MQAPIECTKIPSARVASQGQMIPSQVIMEASWEQLDPFFSTQVLLDIPCVDPQRIMFGKDDDYGLLSKKTKAPKG